MKKIEQFFCYCAGVSLTLLKRCPSETSKYVGIGATILFTGLLAFVSSSYALYFVFDYWLLPLIIGIIWGLMIFNLDRYIVLSMRKSSDGHKELIQAIPRFILAILIAVVISKPLELKIFEKEISTELSLLKQELIAAQEKAILSRFSMKSDSLHTELKILDEEIRKKEESRNQLIDLARQEADGTGGSGKVNPGPIYQIKKKNADQAQEEFTLLKIANEKKKSAIWQQLDSIEVQKKQEYSKLEVGSINGISFQLTALARLGKQYGSIYYANIFIILLFIVIETTPILAKLISPRGPYDDLLEVHENQFRNYRKEKLYKSDQRLERLVISDIN